MTGPDPLMRRLADANPVPPDHLEGDRHSPAAIRLLARLTAPGGVRPSTGGGRGRRRTAILAAAIVVLAGTALLLRAGGEPPATASELLLRTAATAARTDAPIGEGRYLYTKIQSDQLTISGDPQGSWSVILPSVEEMWVAPDGSGRIRSTIGEPRFPGPRDRTRWIEAGSPSLPSGSADDTFPSGALVYEDVRLLPTEPDRLHLVLQEQVATEDLPSDVAVFIRIGELLASGDAPPDLRAALYTAASRLPRIELVGETTDPIGRPGVAVAMTYDESGSALRVVMIFDPQTSSLLAQEQYLLEPASWIDAPPGTRITYTAYVGAGKTPSVESTP